ncbi:TonB-denpendent receptor [Comamonas testosteroni TK102]|jgi:iron complex outermembrane receptor protein|uniref:TonB-denpendent receptor n=2 Tax=Comamonadaceae TaxID=80864 RepID=A0A076PI72_COMTE|nr:TonB-denpendent receptor [Comamonas testosteroni TK102]MPS88936.1 TonB-dependent receptor [Comamonas sp.]
MCSHPQTFAALHSALNSKPQLRHLGNTALKLLLLCPAVGMAQQSLPEVTVRENRLPSHELQTSQPSTTASHVNVPVLDLPASVSGVSSLQMDERADYRVSDTVTRTVGLSTSGAPGNGGLSFSSRGFNGVNSIGIAEDGIMLGVASGTVNYPGDSWGYERIEVLRGPASLMYGSGTTGATMNAIRKQPSRERSTEVLLGAGSHGKAYAGIGAGGALGETLSYRLDAYGDRTDGERELGKASSGKLMSALRWTPRSDLTVDLSADISQQKPERYFGSPVVDGQIVKELRNKNYNVLDAIDQFKDQRFRAKAQWRASDALTVRNELYHFKSDRHWKNIEAYDYQPATGQVGRSDYLEIGHDVQQTGNRMGLNLKAASHQIAVGWDISNAQFTSTSNSPYTGKSTVSAFNPQHGYWDSPDAYLPRMNSSLRQNALYLEDAWKISEQWLLMAGMRRDWYAFSRNNIQDGSGFDKPLNGTSWRLGLTHKFDALSSAYVQTSTGHDPVTSLLAIAQSQTGFSLSQGRQIEVGYKQQLADGRGEWTVAAYRIVKDDIITRDPDRPALSVQGGKQSSKGIELTGLIHASKTLRFEGNIAYVDAKFDRLLEGSKGVDRAGNRPSNVPRVTANLWGHYRTGPWQASLGMRYVGDRFGDNANTVRMPSYVVTDAVLSWDMNPRTTLRLVGRNLTNRLYATYAYSGNQWLLGRGRSVELSALMRF